MSQNLNDIIYLLIYINLDFKWAISSGFLYVFRMLNKFKMPKFKALANWAMLEYYPIADNVYMLYLTIKRGRNVEITYSYVLVE